MYETIFRASENCANLDENIDFLTTIYNDISLREDLEGLIDLHFKKPEFSGCYSSDNAIKNRYKSEIQKLSQIHNIEPFAIELYFSLDRNLFNSYSSFYYPFGKKYLSVEKLSKSIDKTTFKSFISPCEFGPIFSNDRVDQIKFIFENIHLFPNSSQKFFEKKFELRNNQPNIDRIYNDFVYRSLLISLDDKINLPQLNTYHNKFVKHEDMWQRFFSSIYFRKAIIEKYDITSNNDKDLNKFLKKQNNYIYNKSAEVFEDIMNNYTNISLNSFHKIISLFKEDTELALNCFKHHKEANFLELNFLITFLNIFKNNHMVYDDMSTHLYKVILGGINNSLKGFNLNEYSSAEIILDTFEKKWFKKFPLVKLNISKLYSNGII